MVLLHRRALIGAALALPLAFPSIVRGQSCGLPTPQDMEGPFYKAGAPARASLLEPGMKGERLVLAGRVLALDCKPVAGAMLDFWQADEKGEYDNAGFRLRGKLQADGEGRYRLETILPPPYMGRPRHIHVKLQRPGGRVLTTQLYFPGEARGADRALVVKMERAGAELHAQFDFVL
jgi:protocatechuate 3,4-dioxygenase beta subunit